MSNYAPAVDAATTLITFLANQRTDVGISEISRGTGLNKNIVFRILNSLEQQGWVYVTEQKYGLTLVPFQVTSSILSRTNLYNISFNPLHSLWEKTGESTYLGILRNYKVTYIQHFDCIKDVRVAGRIGGEYDIYCSAPGKALLAYEDNDYIEKYADREFVKRAENTITDKAKLLKELETVRVNGYATDREEFSNGIACVAAPVFDYTNKAVGAVGCSSFAAPGSSQAVIERLLPDVLEAADKISVCLGCVKSISKG